MILITECTKCPNLYLIDRHNSLCALKKNEQIRDAAVIPTWCPLPSGPLNKESTQKELRYGWSIFRISNNPIFYDTKQLKLFQIEQIKVVEISDPKLLNSLEIYDSILLKLVGNE